MRAISPRFSASGRPRHGISHRSSRRKSLAPATRSAPLSARDRRRRSSSEPGAHDGGAQAARLQLPRQSTLATANAAPRRAASVSAASSVPGARIGVGAGSSRQVSQTMIVTGRSRPNRRSRSPGVADIQFCTRTRPVGSHCAGDLPRDLPDRAPVRILHVADGRSPGFAGHRLLPPSRTLSPSGIRSRLFAYSCGDSCGLETGSHRIPSSPLALRVKRTVGRDGDYALTRQGPAVNADGSRRQKSVCATAISLYSRSRRRFSMRTERGNAVRTVFEAAAAPATVCGELCPSATGANPGRRARSSDPRARRPAGGETNRALGWRAKGHLAP